MFRVSLLLFAVGCAWGCQSPVGDLREWRPTDHDHTVNPNSTQVEVSDTSSSPLAQHGIDEVTLVTWKRNCVTCHGSVGAGDGPQGSMSGARDLRDPAWQAATSNEAIERVIREGRGRMPPFALPDSTVASLVRLVRLFDPNRQQKVAPPAASASAPAMP